MKKILLGFIAIGLLTFVGCEKEGDTEITDSTDTSSDDGSTDSETETTSSSYSIEYGGGATDIDGNTYKSVIIGEQEWMVENLKTSKYNDGTAIPNVTGNTQWKGLSTGAWSHYDNDSSQYEATYGKLYNWYAVETEKLCPKGWHVPTAAEWIVLIDYLSADGHSGAEEKALKATSGWDYDSFNGKSGNGTDDYGWLGLPGGVRSYFDGSFGVIGNFGYWWSSSQNGANDSWFRNLDASGGNNAWFRNKKSGFSVRCLRD